MDEQQHEENVSLVLQAIKTELREFRNENKLDFQKLKEEIKGDMKAELKEIKTEIYQHLSANSEKINTLENKVTEAETRLAGTEALNLAMKDALVKVIVNHKATREKLMDLEGRSRRNNIRLYGVPEGKEKDSVVQFVDTLLKSTLSLPEDMRLDIQRAHRALTQKPGENAPPRSIIINFHDFLTKESILRKAWANKVTYEGHRLSFDHDYANDVVQRRREYVSIKKNLKERGIRFQTPLDKIRIHWDTGVRTYGTAREAALEMRRRGHAVPLPEPSPAELDKELASLTRETAWQHVDK